MASSRPGVATFWLLFSSRYTAHGEGPTVANLIARLIRPDAYERVPMTEKERKNLIGIGVVGLLLVAIGLFALWIQEANAEAFWMAGAYMSLAGLIGIYALCKAVFFPFEWKQTTEESERQLAAQKAAPNEPDIFDSAWYVRYPVAIIGSWVFIRYVLPRFGSDWSWIEWIIIGGAVLAALALTREVSLILLGIGGLLLVFNWLSGIEITTPGAIIIGAIIIGYAIVVTNDKKVGPRKRSRRLGRRR